MAGLAEVLLVIMVVLVVALGAIFTFDLLTILEAGFTVFFATILEDLVVFDLVAIFAAGLADFLAAILVVALAIGLAVVTGAASAMPPKVRALPSAKIRVSLFIGSLLVWLALALPT